MIARLPDLTVYSQHLAPILQYRHWLQISGRRSKQTPERLFLRPAPARQTKSRIQNGTTAKKNAVTERHFASYATKATNNRPVAIHQTGKTQRQNTATIPGRANSQQNLTFLFAAAPHEKKTSATTSPLPRQRTFVRHDIRRQYSKIIYLL